MSRPHHVGVTPAAALASRPRLFRALELAFPVTFAPLACEEPPDAVIEFDRRAGARAQGAIWGIPTISFQGDRGRGVPETVQLSDHDSVDRRLRAVSLACAPPAGAPAPVPAAEDVLAVGPSGPRWTRSRADSLTHTVAGALPELGAKEVLRQLLFSAHGLSVVAIIHFLRALCADSTFAEPPLRAAIVFDDPNLRWQSYGFIDFRELVRHADAHGYHAVMAMVPRDATRAHGRTVSLFRARPDRLSLAYHGNSHTREELLGPSDSATAAAMCAQAVRRVRGFESRTGLTVDRVMNPPHGRCSMSAAFALAAVGFEALYAIHPEPWSQEPDPERLLSGWGPATFAGPLAVIPRVSIYAPPSEVALRAFMGNPIVLYGHHEDLAHGLELLEQAVSVVNGLGDVRWGSLATIARSNLCVRSDGDVVLARPYAARTHLRLPAGARGLSVQAPRDAEDLRGWSQSDEPVVTDFDRERSCTAGRGVDIHLRPRTEIDPTAVGAPARRPWASLRRVATETRDRAMPLSPARRFTRLLTASGRGVGAS